MIARGACTESGCHGVLAAAARYGDPFSSGVARSVHTHLAHRRGCPMFFEDLDTLTAFAIVAFAFLVAAVAGWAEYRGRKVD
jgi:hypothetical protein